jgi:hypothetical protein
MNSGEPVFGGYNDASRSKKGYLVQIPPDKSGSNSHPIGVHLNDIP